MKLYVLFAQRECAYPGQYAPEALEVMDDVAMDDNCTWLEEQRTKYQKTKEFTAVEIIEVNLGKEANSKINEALNDYTKVNGEV